MSSAACQIAYLDQMDVPRLAPVATEAAYALGGSYSPHSQAVTRFLIGAMDAGLGWLWSREAERPERWWRCGHCGDRRLEVRSTDDHYCRRCCRLSGVMGPPATCTRYGLTLAGYSFGVDGEAYADAVISNRTRTVPLGIHDICELWREVGRSDRTIAAQLHAVDLFPRRLGGASAGETEATRLVLDAMTAARHALIDARLGR